MKVMRPVRMSQTRPIHRVTCPVGLWKKRTPLTTARATRSTLGFGALGGGPRPLLYTHVGGGGVKDWRRRGVSIRRGVRRSSAGRAQDEDEEMNVEVPSEKAKAAWWAAIVGGRVVKCLRLSRLHAFPAVGIARLAGAGGCSDSDRRRQEVGVVPCCHRSVMVYG